MAFQYGLLQCHTNPSQVENLPGKSSETNMLFDCGNSQNRVLRNAEITGINLPTIDVIMLSQGHFDQFTASVNILKRIGKPLKTI